MPLVLRMILAAAGALAALLIGHDSPEFDVVQGMLGTALIALVVAVLAFLSKR